MTAAQPSLEHGRLIRKLASISELTEQDREALSALPIRTRTVDAGVELIAQGATPAECCFIVEGLVCRYSLTGSGGKQIVSFHLAGDIPDRDSLHLLRLDHAVSSISPTRLAYISHRVLIPLLSARPNVAVAFWRDSVIDAGVFRQWLTSLGRRSAKQRVAHLICEMYTRMDAVGLADGDHFSFPVTQTQLADALGLSPVHVNRTLQELKGASLISWKGPVLTIHDAEALRELGDFDPAYLELRPMVTT